MPGDRLTIYVTNSNDHYAANKPEVHSQPHPATSRDENVSWLGVARIYVAAHAAAAAAVAVD